MAEQESLEALEVEKPKPNEDVEEDEEEVEEDEEEELDADEDDEEEEGGGGELQVGELQSSGRLGEVEEKESQVETLAVPSSRELAENDRPPGRCFRK